MPSRKPLLFIVFTIIPAVTTLANDSHYTVSLHIISLVFFIKIIERNTRASIQESGVHTILSCLVLSHFKSGLVDLTFVNPREPKSFHHRSCCSCILQTNQVHYRGLDPPNIVTIDTPAPNAWFPSANQFLVASHKLLRPKCASLPTLKSNPTVITLCQAGRSITAYRKQKPDTVLHNHNSLYQSKTPYHNWKHRHLHSLPAVTPSR